MRLGLTSAKMRTADRDTQRPIRPRAVFLRDLVLWRWHITGVDPWQTWPNAAWLPGV